MRFRQHRIIGDIIELAQRYRDEGADELVFYDITASPEGRTVDRAWISRVAEAIDIPFCVAGGIRTVADAETILNAGADKISVNSPALADPGLVDRLAKRFGTQCVVVGIDSQASPAGLEVFQLTGSASTSNRTSRQTLQWVSEVQQRGAGEIVLNCMNHDGVRRGYDIAQLQQVRAASTVPLIASGGAGCEQDFSAVFRDTGVDGALAASVFHSGEIRIAALKTYLSHHQIPIRPCA